MLGTFSTPACCAITVGVVIAFAVGGCDPDWPEHGKTSKVVGEVTLDGVALVKTTVVFIPRENRVGGEFVPIAFGQTDAQGKFTLTTSTNSEQVSFGKYTVILSQKAIDKFGQEYEFVPEKFNRKSTLTYEIETQEAFDRPFFGLRSDGDEFSIEAL